MFDVREGEEEVGMVVGEAAEVVEGQRDGLEELVLSLEEATIAVGSKGLEDAEEEVGPELGEPLAPCFAPDSAHTEVVLHEFVTYGLGEIAFGAIEDGGHIVLRRPTTGPLEVDVV